MLPLAAPNSSGFVSSEPDADTVPDPGIALSITTESTSIVAFGTICLTCAYAIEFPWARIVTASAESGSKTRTPSVESFER
jgi:hypothetical protein